MNYSPNDNSIADEPLTDEQLQALPELPAEDPDAILTCRHQIWVGRSAPAELSVTSGEGGHWIDYSTKTIARELDLGSDPRVPRAIQVKLDAAQVVAENLAPRMPSHLPLRVRPHEVEFEHRDPEIDGKRFNTVFPPEDRKVYRDTAYPWSTIGRVRGAPRPDGQPGKGGTGTLVGPRHVLTASHVAFNPDGSPKTARFHPAYYNGESLLGSAAVVEIWHYEIVVRATKANEFFDYAVLVLDSPLGELCGWMGTRPFRRNWSGLTSWAHAGYPGDFKLESHVPTYQITFPVELPGEYDETHSALDHRADTSDGNSGGPLFALWPFQGKPMPYIVGVHSSESFDERKPNSAPAGEWMVALVKAALAGSP